MTYRLLRTYAQHTLCTYCRRQWTGDRYAALDRDGIERDRVYLCSACAR